MILLRGDGYGCGDNSNNNNNVNDNNNDDEDDDDDTYGRRSSTSVNDPCETGTEHQ